MRGTGHARRLRTVGSIRPAAYRGARTKRVAGRHRGVTTKEGHGDFDEPVHKNKKQ